MNNNGGLTIAPWLSDKRCAYSITYDDGLIETAGFAWRIHCQYEIPGHINVMPHKLGDLDGDSSAGFLQSLWNLQKYMDVETLQFLLSEGWSLGCQFPLGEQAPTADELAQVRLFLMQAVSHQVSVLAVSDYDSAVTWQTVAHDAGFRWLLSVFDALNDYAQVDSPIIRRSPLYHRSPAPILLANDPFRLLALARDRQGWIVDVVRLVDRFPLDPARDCTPAELTARFEALRRICGDDFWAATPERVAAYRSWRGASKCVAITADHADALTWRLEVTESQLCPQNSELTFVVRPPLHWNSPLVTVDNHPVPVSRGKEANVWQFNHRVVHGQRIEIVNEDRRLA